MEKGKISLWVSSLLPVSADPAPLVGEQPPPFPLLGHEADLGQAILQVESCLALPSWELTPVSVVVSARRDLAGSLASPGREGFWHLPLGLTLS